jgi:transcriptional pleiotropic regulator of transition state genes
MSKNVKKGGIDMKSTGIIRRVDELGRVVLPIELRNKFGITEKDPMEIYVDGNSIILKKYEPNCIFCGGSKKLMDYEGKVICEKCAQKISNLKAE